MIKPYTMFRECPNLRTSNVVSNKAVKVFVVNFLKRDYVFYEYVRICSVTKIHGLRMHMSSRTEISPMNYKFSNPMW